MKREEEESVSAIENRILNVLGDVEDETQKLLSLVYENVGSLSQDHLNALCSRAEDAKALLTANL